MSIDPEQFLLRRVQFHEDVLYVAGRELEELVIEANVDSVPVDALYHRCWSLAGLALFGLGNDLRALETNSLEE